MIIQNVIGNINDLDFQDYHTVWLTMPFDHAHKRIQKFDTEDGLSIGLRLDEETRVKGLSHGDVLYRDEKKKIQYAIEIAEVPVIVIHVKDVVDMPAVAYVIGNRHAQLYQGKTDYELITPYEKTLEDMLLTIDEITISKDHRKLISENSLMSILPSNYSGHDHDHDHDHEHHDHSH